MKKLLLKEVVEEIQEKELESTRMFHSKGGGIMSRTPPQEDQVFLIITKYLR